MKVSKGNVRLAVGAALVGALITAGIGLGWQSLRQPAAEPSSTATTAPSDPTTPTPTSNPTTAPSTSNPSDPARPSPAGFPNADTTGVRPGVALTNSDSIVVDKAGTVIERLRVKGRIVVEADDVTIRDTLVEGGGTHYPIRIARGVKNVLIEHVEVQNDPGGGIGIFFNGGTGTVRHANIHTATDGIRVQADDVTIEYSYIHDLRRSEGGHHDSIQIRSGANTTIRGNTLLPYVASTDDPMNAAIQIGSLAKGPLVNLVVEKNFMDGGNYTINGGKDVESGSFIGNTFGPHARYGVRSGMPAGVEWRDNKMAGTGKMAE